MSKRESRSIKQVLEATFKQKSRPLTEDDIQRIKKLLVAFMIHRKRGNSPTDYNDWDQLRPVLKEGFDNVLKGKTTTISSQNQAQRKWQELCESLVASGVISWTSLMSGIKKALSQIKYTNENPVEDLLSEGNIRRNIFKNLGLSSIKKILNHKNISDFSNDEKLDLIMVINDPSSMVNDEIHISILHGLFDAASTILNIQANIVDKKGNITDVAKVDVNVINPKLGTYLESALRGYKEYDGYEAERYTFVTYLIDLNADTSIPLKLEKGSRNNTLNAFSYALLKSVNNTSMWDIVKYILQKRPISDSYHPKLDSPHAFGKYNSISSSFKRTIDTIDLVWIIKNMSFTQINWLITHGGLNVQTMLEDYEIALNDIKKAYEPLKADLDRHEQKRIEMKKVYDAIVDKVVDIKNKFDLYQAQYNALQNKRELVQQLRDAHNVRGGKKRTSRNI